LKKNLKNCSGDDWSSRGSLVLLFGTLASATQFIAMFGVAYGSSSVKPEVDPRVLFGVDLGRRSRMPRRPPRRKEWGRREAYCQPSVPPSRP
jgi:hypothetical protein